VFILLGYIGGEPAREPFTVHGLFLVYCYFALVLSLFLVPLFLNRKAPPQLPTGPLSTEDFIKMIKKQQSLKPFTVIFIKGTVYMTGYYSAKKWHQT